MTSQPDPNSAPADGPLSPPSRPQQHSPFSDAGADLSDGENKKLAIEIDTKLRPFVRDVRIVRGFQIFTVIFTAFAVAVLLCMLWKVVTAFSVHVRESTPLLAEAIKEASRLKSEPAEQVKGDKKNAQSQLTASPRSTVAASAQSTASAAPIDSSLEHFYSMISTNLTSLSTSVVAVISILVVAVTVTSIAILRSTLSLSPYHGGEGEKKSEDKTKESDKGYALPGIEIAKAIIDALSSAIKGISDKK